MTSAFALRIFYLSLLLPPMLIASSNTPSSVNIASGKYTSGETSTLHNPLLTTKISYRSDPLEWKWNPKKKELEAFHVKKTGIPFTIKTPIPLDNEPRLIWNSPYLLLIPSNLLTQSSLFSSEESKQAAWIYDSVHGQWQSSSTRIDSQINWIHASTCDQIFILDGLVDKENSREKAWVRYWIEPKTGSIHSSFPYKAIEPLGKGNEGGVRQMLINPDPKSGSFRYAYLLHGNSSITKWDLMRSHARLLELAEPIVSIALKPMNKSHQEDDLILILVTASGTKNYRAADLSPYFPESRE